MNIFFLIFFPIALYALMSFHRAFLLYAPMRLFLSHLVPFLAESNLPHIYMVSVMDTFMVVCFAIDFLKKRKVSLPYEPFPIPLKKAFILCFISMFTSAVLSPLLSIGSELSSVFQRTISDFIFLYLLWRELKSIKDIKYYINVLVIVFTIAIAYGFYERFDDFENPLIDYEEMLNNDGIMHHFRYDTDDRAGLGRVQSFFYTALSCSAYCGVAFSFFYYINLRYKKLWKVPNLMKISFMSGLLFLLLFSNSRGGMLYIGIVLLFTLSLKSMLRLSLFLPILFIVFYDIIEPYILTITSVVKPNTHSEVRGSDMTMRLVQLVAVIQAWEGSPLFGYGRSAVGYWQERMPAMLGVDSLLLQLLLTQGIFGVIAHIAYFFYSLMKLAIGKSKRYIISVVFACMVVSLATRGMDIVFFISLLLIIYRLELWNSNQKLMIK